MRPDEFSERLRQVVNPRWVRPGASATDLDLAERRLGITISDELRMFYGCVGGTDEATPLENGWMKFWPVERWERAAQAHHGHARGLVLLADHSLSSWWYATPFAERTQTPIFIVDGLRPPRVIARSFSSFVDAVFADDHSIYPEPLPGGAGQTI
jgi:hypothetical protein